jgi:hypothetical protein
MSHATLCLWYDKAAEEAARFYAQTFPDSHVGAVHRAPGDLSRLETSSALVACRGDKWTSGPAVGAPGDWGSAERPSDRSARARPGSSQEVRHLVASASEGVAAAPARDQAVRW